MVEPPFQLPYEIPEIPKAYSDYEWDDNYPGTFKPGKREENYPLDKVFELWKDRENPAAIELRTDELWAVPLAPPEDILGWLERIGLLQDEEHGSSDEYAQQPSTDSRRAPPDRPSRKTLPAPLPIPTPTSLNLHV
jgi:hypothetical protein